MATEFVKVDCRRYFKMFTAKNCHEFDFRNIKSEKKIYSFIDTVIQVLF